MPYNLVKSKLLDLFRYNIQPRIEALHAEQIYQGIFAQQCQAKGIVNDFYPVGAAASYSLMYLLTRVLSELPVKRVVELGCGQTTLLIDRIGARGGRHVAYEQNAMWANIMRSRVQHCDLRERPVVALQRDGIAYEGYRDMEMEDFDLLLVDGPNGADHFSRYSCVPLIDANRASEFIIIVDDAARPGEQETVAAISKLLTGKSVDFKLNYLDGRTTQAVFTTPAFRAASYFY